MKSNDKLIILITVMILVIASVGIILWQPSRRGTFSNSHDSSGDWHKTPNENIIIHSNISDNDTKQDNSSIFQKRIDTLSERNFVLFRNVRIKILEFLEKLIS